MKVFKLLCVLALIITAPYIRAQESDTETHNPLPVPGKGRVMTEVNFTPFAGNVISIDKLRVKYSLTNRLALRMGMFADNKSGKQTNADNDMSVSYPDIYNQKSFEWGLLPGIEFHILKNSRISPYFGVELSYYNKSSSQSRSVHIKNSNGGVDKDFYIDYKANEGWVDTSRDYADNLINRSYQATGGNLLFGTDFYFIRNFYFGFEVGISYSQFKYKKGSIENSNAADTYYFPSYTDTTFGLYYNNAIRVGVWF